MLKPPELAVWDLDSKPKAKPSVVQSATCPDDKDLDLVLDKKPAHHDKQDNAALAQAYGKGYLMLKAMGWSQEEGGCGKSRDGITTPLKVIVKRDRLGLATPTEKIPQQRKFQPISFQRSGSAEAKLNYPQASQTVHNSESNSYRTSQPKQEFLIPKQHHSVVKKDVRLPSSITATSGEEEDDSVHELVSSFGALLLHTPTLTHRSKPSEKKMDTEPCSSPLVFAGLRVKPKSVHVGKHRNITKSLDIPKDHKIPEQKNQEEISVVSAQDLSSIQMSPNQQSLILSIALQLGDETGLPAGDETQQSPIPPTPVRNAGKSHDEVDSLLNELHALELDSPPDSSSGGLVEHGISTNAGRNHSESSAHLAEASSPVSSSTPPLAPHVPALTGQHITLSLGLEMYNSDSDSASTSSDES